MFNLPKKLHYKKNLNGKKTKWFGDLTGFYSITYRECAEKQKYAL